MFVHRNTSDLPVFFLTAIKGFQKVGPYSTGRIILNNVLFTDGT